MHDVRGDLELRPNSVTGLIMLVVMAGAGAGLVAAVLIGDAPTVFAPIVGAAFAVLVILATGALLTSRITLTPHEIIERGMFIRRRRPRSRVTKVVRATIQMPKQGAGESLFLLDAHGKLVTRVNVGLYKREDVDRLVKTLGVPSSGPDHFGSADEFARTHPGLVSSAERHPYRITFAITGVVSVAALVVALVWIAA